MEIIYKKITSVAIKHFFEMLIINVALSVVVTALNQLGVLDKQQTIFAATTAGVVLSMIINIALLRGCYYDVANRRIYYISSYLACAAFIIVNLGVGFLFNNYVYAWLFGITKFARFSHFQWDSLVSAILFNILMIASIHIAPLGMGWLVLDDDYEE